MRISSSQVPASCSTHHYRNRYLLCGLFVVVLASNSGNRSQAAAQLTISGPTQLRYNENAQYNASVAGTPGLPIVWSINGSVGGTLSTGPISASGVYSPAGTIFAGHSVTIGAAVRSQPALSASLQVKILNPLPMLTAGSVTQTTPNSSFSVDVRGSGFVPASQLQISGVAIPTTFVSSGELEGVISLPAGSTTITAGVLNPDAAQKSAVTRALLVQAAPSAVVSAFYCMAGSFMGSGTLNCRVVLNQSAASGGQSVSFSSSNQAVTLPGTVTIPANATNTLVSVSIQSVLTSAAVTLSATTGGITLTNVLQLVAATRTVSASATGLNFADTVVNTAPMRPVTFTSTGSEPITISAVSLTGVGFSLSGGAFPVILSPGQALTLTIQFHPLATGTMTGQLAVSSNSTGDGMMSIALRGSSLPGPSTAATPRFFTYGGSPLLNTLVPPNPFAGISRNLFGLTIFNLASNSSKTQPGITPFPTFAVSTLRLLDVADWPLIDTYEGENNWTKLDNTVSIAQQNGVSDLIYTFGHVPAWASTDPTSPCTDGEGPGSCAPPNMDVFEGFVTQVIQRYCGKIEYYEPWNEPDSTEFWAGNNGQLLTIAQQVYQIAKNPANCGCTNGICSPNGGANPNKVLLPPISALNQAQIDWLDSYLAAAGTPYPYADITAFHGYVWKGFPLEDIVPQVQVLQQTLAKYGLSSLPLWNDETSWELNTYIDPDQQASWIMRYYATQAVLGIPRVIEFSYDNCIWGSLWSSPLCPDNASPTGQLTEGGAAYATIENWFIGANLTHCQQYQNGLWACELQRSESYDAWMLWSSTGASIPVPVPSALGLTAYRDWQNSVAPLPSAITVGEMPVLLENTDL